MELATIAGAMPASRSWRRASDTALEFNAGGDGTLEALGQRIQLKTGDSGLLSGFKPASAAVANAPPIRG